MHPKVFVKLKKTLKTLSSGQKNPKKTQKNPKNPKKTKKNQKNPLGWVFLKKPGFFPTLLQHHELHEDELGYAGSYEEERLTFSIMSFMKMSWDMRAAVGKD